MDESTNEILKDIVDGSFDEIIKTNDNSKLEPEVGMTFNLEDQACEFYNSYTRKMGFMFVRKIFTKEVIGLFAIGFWIMTMQVLV